VHDDHVADFDTSREFQSLFMNPETYTLLVAKFSAALPIRDNVTVFSYGTALNRLREPRPVSPVLPQLKLEFLTGPECNPASLLHS
jgi:hypothetical protein